MKVIRTLWGDNFPGSRWKKVWRSNVLPAMSQAWSMPQTVYVFGTENAERLADLKNPFCNIVLMDEDPWGGQSPDQDSPEHDTWLRPWILKWLAIDRAKEKTDIIYCDWDVHCDLRQEQIPHVRELLSHRRVALSGYKYKRVRHPSRPDRRSQRFSVSGNWIYISRQSSFSSCVVNEMSSSGKWNWHDEIAIGNMLDQIHGGWMGEKEWLENYESPIMVQSNRRCPWTLEKKAYRTMQGDTPIPFTWTKYFWQ